MTPDISRGRVHVLCPRTTSYTDYQPIERLGTFHLIEFGVFTGLALLLFAVTWRLMRRTTRL